VRNKIVLTDHAWPDLAIERSIAERAGFELVAAQISAGDARSVESFVAAHDPVAIMTCWAQVSAHAIASPTNLRIVARLGVGLDNIDVGAATRRGAWVTNVPDYCVEEVSDHAIAMLLDQWRGITKFDAEVKAGRWQPSTARLDRVSAKTVGIVGYGKIGRATARKLAGGFGCRILVTSPSLMRQHAVGASLESNVQVADIAQMQLEADAIVLHLPLNDASRYLVNDAFLVACKRKPILVNVSRGGLVDNAALARALDSGSIRAAALDVVDGEPSPPEFLVQRRDVLVTPHIAFTSDASLRELRQRCTEDVVRVLCGERPVHACNDPRP
jgi:D-3-phosphoglycerate dehydrogenase / 2-oxoglutarate reductase